MVIELNRATFRRLVQLQLILSLLAAGLAGLSMASRPWPQFDAAFRILLREQFEQLPLPQGILLILVLVVAVCGFWHLFSLIGLLSFERWARTGCWVSIVFGLMAGVVLTGVRPFAYLTPLDGLLGFINSASFGTVMLLAYARGLGAEWFTPVLAERKT